MAEAYRETAYERWIGQEGVPVVRGYGITDLGLLELGPWPRLGGRGAYVQLHGMEGYTGMYVAEIPPSGALQPEKHLYDELVYVLSGRGATEVWTGPRERPVGGAHLFEWQTGSLFAPPINTWHRLVNGSGTEPVRLLAVTTAPVVMDLFHNVPFVFNSEWVFDDRYDGRADYFGHSDTHFSEHGWLLDTNFIPDVRADSIHPQDFRGGDHPTIKYEIAGNVLIGHIADWAAGIYDEAHHHGGGAILLMVRSRGYTLMWPREVGVRPYQDGHTDQLVRVDWQEGSVLSPPSGWFHQHFTTGSEPSREVALRYGSRKHRVGFFDASRGRGVDVSIKLGGTMIPYEDEDPEIRRQYEHELEKLPTGVA